MSDRHYDGTMTPLPFHDNGDLVDRKPVRFEFIEEGVRTRARRKSVVSRAGRKYVNQLLKRMDQEKERKR